MATRTLATADAPRATLGLVAIIASRMVAAALVAAMGAIHFHLWSTGYRHLHVIGILFLLNAAGGILLAAALLFTPTRLLSVVAGLAAVFTAGTLVGLIVSVHHSLFGFREFSGAPYETESIWLESIAIVVTLVVAGATARTTIDWYRGRSGRPDRA